MKIASQPFIFFLFPQKGNYKLHTVSTK
jgi:hypothetical protein